MDLKIVSENEASHLQNSEVFSRQGGRGLVCRLTGTTLENYRSQSPKKEKKKKKVRIQKFLQTKSFWSPLKVPFHNPHCPCIFSPWIPPPRQGLNLSPGESVLEIFNCLGHHGGYLLHRFPATAHLWQMGSGSAWACVGQLLMGKVKAVAAGGSMAGFCGVWGWLDLDFFKDSCFSCFKLLPPLDVRRWLGQRAE